MSIFKPRLRTYNIVQSQDRSIPTRKYYCTIITWNYIYDNDKQCRTIPYESRQKCLCRLSCLGANLSDYYSPFVLSNKFPFYKLMLSGFWQSSLVKEDLCWILLQHLESTLL